MRVVNVAILAALLFGGFVAHAGWSTEALVKLMADRTGLSPAEVRGKIDFGAVRHPAVDAIDPSAPGNLSLRDRLDDRPQRGIRRWDFPDPIPSLSEVSAVTDAYLASWPTGHLTYQGGVWVAIPQDQIEAAAQGTKPANVKALERKLFDQLTTDGIISAEAKIITKADLVAALDAYDELPGNAGDSKASKLLRLCERLRLLGHQPEDAYRHP